LVPVIRDADTMDFRTFLLAYEDLVRKVHGGAFGADDFVGATVSLTNPGTLGTVQSVPRLMPGQGAIFGVGALGWPAGFEAADPRALAELGVGKVLTLTSTYDHRIIQGAESGLFLKYVAECLTGGTSSTTRSSPRSASLRAGALGPGPQPLDQRRRRRADPEADPRPGADQHVPRARAPQRAPRPAAL
jgi:hypothetical protein